MHTLHKKNEQGVTLVIAIVMLAVVAFVTFVISAIIIREIGVSRTVLRTEPAISAANAGGEVGIFSLLREAGDVTSSGSTQQSNATYDVLGQLYENPFEFEVTAENPTTKIALYDAEDLENQETGYSMMNLFNDGPQPIRITVYSWENTKSPICGTTRTLANGQSLTDCDLNRSDDRYLIEVTLNSASGSAKGRIFADREGQLADGVPTDNPGLVITGVNQDVQRRLEIKLNPAE